MTKFNFRSFIKVIVTISSIVILIFSFLLFQFLNTPLIRSSQQPINFVFEPGTTVVGLAYKLQKLKVIQSPMFFVLFVEMSGSSKKLHAGEYKVVPGTNVRHLLLMLQKGEVVKHGITFVEGWTFQQVKIALLNNPYLVHELKGLNNDAIMQKIGESGKAPEGMFAPDTYIFSGKISDAMVLRSSYNLMQKRLQTAWQNRAFNAPYKCTYETLIAASMIEKESAVSQERPLIAGVIIKRLQLGMPLQIDAAVIYGLMHNCGEDERCIKDISGAAVSLDDLKQDTSYNNYIHKGLPPTPISMPSADAINAALHPIISDKLYYVAKGDGTHIFSSTLAEHDAARRQK